MLVCYSGVIRACRKSAREFTVLLPCVGYCQNGHDWPLANSVKYGVRSLEFNLV